MSRRSTRILVFAAATFVVFVGAAFSPAGDGPLADGLRQFDTGNYPQAAASLRAALERDAQDAGLHYWLARCYFELHDFDRAVASAERAVQLEPDNSLYHLWLGRAYGRKAEHAGWISAFPLAKKSRREFEEAVRVNPHNFEAQHDLIEFYYSAPGIVGGGDDKARRQIEALSSLDAGEGHLTRGEFLLHRKKPDQAEAEFRLALQAELKRVEPYLAIADFYLERNDAGRMEAAVEAAARVDASDRRLSYYRGVAGVLRGDRLQEAEQLLKTYLATVPERSDYPSHASVHDWLGRLYERQHRCDAAVEEYRVALGSDPRDNYAREALRRLRNCLSGE